MIREEIVHINGFPQKLVVFLHGYLDDSDSVDVRLREFYESLPNCAIHIPQAPFSCEVDAKMRQWYSMYRFDPAYERKNAPDLQSFVKYYNRMSLGLSETHGFLLPYLEQTLAEYNLQYKDLFLCGFSQGAMAAIYTALMSPQEIGGLISFSGIIAGYEYLGKNAKQTPPVLLLHGQEDKMIRPDSLKFTAEKLSKIGCEVMCDNIPGNGHQLNHEGMQHAVHFIKSHTK